jgi:hypothetical protein
MINSGILYNADHASLLYIKKREYLYLTIEGFVCKETLFHLAEALIKGIKQSMVKRIIFDTSKLKIISKDDILLFKQAVLPIIEKSGIKKIIFISSEDVFGNKTIESLSVVLNQKIPTRVFPNMEKAELWLFND